MNQIEKHLELLGSIQNQLVSWRFNNFYPTHVLLPMDYFKHGVTMVANLKVIYADIESFKLCFINDL